MYGLPQNKVTALQYSHHTIFVRLLKCDWHKKFCTFLQYGSVIRNKYMIQQEIPEVIPASQCRHDGIIADIARFQAACWLPF